VSFMIKTLRKPPCHEQARKGEPARLALGEVLLAFVRWGKQHIPGTVTLNRGPAGGEVAASATNSRRRRTKRAG